MSELVIRVRLARHAVHLSEGGEVTVSLQLKPVEKYHYDNPDHPNARAWLRKPVAVLEFDFLKPSAVAGLPVGDYELVLRPAPPLPVARDEETEVEVPFEPGETVRT